MKRFSILLLIMMLFGCTEPYLLQTSDFEEALVIEATLTNEFKKQQIKLSKTFRLEENGPTFISGATIFIEDNMGNTYNFIEGDKVYESENEFQAISGRKYKLTIKTEGKTYTSTQETLTTVNPIQSVEVTDETINGIRGAEIKVKAFDPTNSSKYYRYEYEETYKIIAPKTSQFIVTVDGSNELVYTPRTTEVRTCYSTEKSNELLLETTANLSEDRVNFTVRFIPVTNPIIMHRYSILVRQYIQNLEAFTYYSTLKKISGNQSILSQNQPGFFSGNIICDSNSNEKVIGFFDVSTVSSERIFFNFVDLFPNTNLPDYFFDCFENCLESNPFDCPGAYNYCFIYPNGPDGGCQGRTVKTYLNGIPQYMLYYSGPNPINLVPPPCGDCTTFSSNVVPSFWQ